MDRFRDAIDFLFRPDVEGGYADDPADAGGATKYGISSAAYPGLDVQHLTREEAAALYRRDYWEVGRCHQLPAPIDLAHFDACVQHGPGTAARLLQEALGVKADGALGPRTLAAAAAQAPHHYLLPDLLSRRAQLYHDLAKRKASQDRFLRGWMRRLFLLQAQCLRSLSL